MQLVTKKLKEDLYLQVNYLRMVSSSLELFKEKGGYLYNLRCPFCGDSQKSRTKARGYVFRSPQDGLLCYKCHNCNVGKSFRAFLKHVNPGLAGQYWLEVFKGSATAAQVQETVKLDTGKALERNLEGADCTPLMELSRLHPARQYIESRKISKEKKELFYYTDNFERFCTSIKNYSDVSDDARVLLFETDAFGNIKLVVARSLEPKAKQRYITLRIDEDYPKAFGYHNARKNKPCYVLEGAIDSLFLSNAVATLDSNVDGNIKNTDLTDPIFILDNEPRSSIIVNKMKKLIDRGSKVVIFDPRNNHKDINDMVKAGIDVEAYLKSRTFSGIKATLEFSKWQKSSIKR